MKKLLTLVSILALTACSSAPKDPFERRVYEDQERREKAVTRAIDEAPKWMKELPKSTSAVYENGTATSYDMGMSVSKAKTMAYGKICMAAGGRVNQQSKIYRTDTNDASTEHSELAIKSFCPGVDITGVEMVDVKMISDRGQFRTYVLVALPTGDANALRKERDQREQRRVAEARSREAFRQMENDAKNEVKQQKEAQQ